MSESIRWTYKRVSEINCWLCFWWFESEKIAADPRVSKQSVKHVYLLVGTWQPLKQAKGGGRMRFGFQFGLGGMGTPGES